MVKKKKILVKDTQISQDSSNRELLATSYYDEYFSYKKFQKVVVNNETLNNWAIELLDWAANDPNALKITQFFLDRGIHSSDMTRFCEKNELLRHSWDIALEQIGNRRERLGLQKKLDSGMVSYTMAHYDKSWKELAEWRAKLREKSEDKNQQTIVVIEKYPSSDIVPEKKE